MMKIISPNILAINSFLQILEKGIYVYNKKNEELGRTGLPYGYDATRLIEYLPWEENSDPVIKQSIKIGNQKFGRIISENGVEVIVYYPEKREKLKKISHSYFIQLAIEAKILDWDKISKENKERGEEEKKKLDKNKDKEPQEREYLTLKELQNKYPNERFGPNEYLRTFTAAEQNHDRDLD